MKTLLVIFLLLTLSLATILTVGCEEEQPSSSGDTSANAAPFDSSEYHRRIYSDPGLPIEVKQGKKFIIALEANPTTGYQWELAEPLDEDMLELVHSRYKAEDAGLVGGGGKEFWVFKALDEGDTAITFQYCRSWEEDKPPAQIETFFVTVE